MSPFADWEMSNAGAFDDPITDVKPATVVEACGSPIPHDTHYWAETGRLRYDNPALRICRGEGDGVTALLGVPDAP